jgi:hypothetical protein
MAGIVTRSVSEGGRVAENGRSGTRFIAPVIAPLALRRRHDTVLLLARPRPWKIEGDVLMPKLTRRAALQTAVASTLALPTLLPREAVG